MKKIIQEMREMDLEQNRDTKRDIQRASFVGTFCFIKKDTTERTPACSASQIYYKMIYYNACP